MNRTSTRRQFGRAVTGLAVGAFAAPAVVRGRNLNERLNIACIGVGGRGGSNLKSVESENIVALCDVYEAAVENAARDHSRARKFRDFRRVAHMVGIRLNRQFVEDVSPLEAHGQARVPADQVTRKWTG